MKKSEFRHQVFGGSCRVVVHSAEGNNSELLELAYDELTRLETKFSSYVAGSITSRINQEAGNGSPIPIDAETHSLFEFVTALWTESKHLFDPTVRLLQNCYDNDGRLLASQEQLRKMLTLVGWSNLRRSDEAACLSARGMLMDLNSCVRPYTIDSVIRILKKNGADNALVEMEQDIATIGKQPDGANWMIGVRFPRGERAGITRLKLNSRGFAMRGDFERAIEIDDESFGRALSPVDGHPIPGLLSVVVIAENCLTACSAASVARMKTELAGLKWLKNLGLPWMAIDRELNCHGPLAP